MSTLRALALDLYNKPYYELSLEERQRLFAILDDAMMSSIGKK